MAYAVFRATRNRYPILPSIYISDADDFDREEIATYEEVARLFPRAGTFRPIVLVGPPGVGRNEIKRRIIAMEPDRFRVTIPRKKSLYIVMKIRFENFAFKKMLL